MGNDKEKELIEKLYEARPVCKECFCNDLCMFLLLRTYPVTSCNDFQERVKKVVDREIKKLTQQS